MKSDSEQNLSRVGLGGGCHWCTEAVFQSLRGVHAVDQGWIASSDEPLFFSEAVVIDYDDSVIPLKVLIEIHLRTHSATSNHFLRTRYRSAVYVFEQNQRCRAEGILEALQIEFDQPLVTKVVYFGEFRRNQTRYLNYYKQDSSRPFCKNYIDPKLSVLREEFSTYLGTSVSSGVLESGGGTSS